MSSSALTGSCGRAAAILAAVLVLARCDLPTEPPRFDLTTGLNAPLLVDRTFVLLGPSETGYDALIDTTVARFDSIFAVDASNQTLSISRELDGFESDLPEGLLPHLDVSPIDFSFSADVLSPMATSGDPGVDIPIQPDGTSFGEGNVVTLELPEIRSFDEGDYVELAGGVLRVDDLTNEFDVAFDELLVSVPSLRRAPYGPSDSLVVRFEHFADSPDDLQFRQVDRQSGPRREEVDLSGYRLYAAGKELSYYVLARSETTDDVRFIHSSERLRLAVRIEEVTVSEVSADLEPLDVAVTTDLNADGRIDVLDDGEANVVAFDGLSVFGGVRPVELELTGSELRLNVRSNIGADFALYAAILGIDDEGNAAYLEGMGSAAVQGTDPATAYFSAGGAPIDPRYLIRLQFEGAPSSDQQVERTIVLDDQNSNVDAFLSRIPTELRMVARLVIQPDGGPVHLREPFLLETSFAATIPLAVASGISLDKTFDADLSNLESVASDSNTATIDEANIELTYGNGLPLGLDLEIDVLDADGDVVVTFPRDGDGMHVEPASTDASGIATKASSGTFSLDVSRADIEAMSRGKRVRLRFSMTTDQNGRARLRATDTFTMRLRGAFRVRLSAD